MRMHEEVLGLELDFNVRLGIAKCIGRVELPGKPLIVTLDLLDRLEVEITRIGHNDKLEIFGFNTQFLRMPQKVVG